MIIDFKLQPERQIAKAILPSSPSTTSSFSFCFGTLFVSLLVGSLLLLTVPLLSSQLRPESNWLTVIQLRSLVSLGGRVSYNEHSEPSSLFFPADWWRGFQDDHAEKPRWTREPLMRRLPQCIIIGVRKSGTRALIEFLNLHPRIKKASDEMHFFDEEQNYQKGLEWYRRKMPFSYADQITVEKSPAYFITRYVPQRIKAMNSTIAVILVVKNPVTRVISDYTQTRTNRIKKGKKFETFEDTVLRGDGSVDASYKPIRVSLYHKHLTNWLKFFRKEQILIVDGDSLISSPVTELQEVEKFLGLDHQINHDHFHFNKTKGFFCIRDSQNPETDRCLSKTKGRPHPDVSPEVIEKLEAFFRPYNERFYALVGKRFEW